MTPMELARTRARSAAAKLVLMRARRRPAGPMGDKVEMWVVMRLMSETCVHLPWKNDQANRSTHGCALVRDGTWTASRGSSMGTR